MEAWIDGVKATHAKVKKFAALVTAKDEGVMTILEAECKEDDGEWCIEESF
jgi:hypothetical protein